MGWAATRLEPSLALNTCRFHGWLIAALPAPHGRMMMLNQVEEAVCIQDRKYQLTADDLNQATHTDTVSRSCETPREWSARVHLASDEFILEKRPCKRTPNTRTLTIRLIKGEEAELELRPGIDVRPHEELSSPTHEDYRFSSISNGYELSVASDLPALRLAWLGDGTSFVSRSEQLGELRCRIEQSRGYDWKSTSGSPGCFSVKLAAGRTASLVASAEAWDNVSALTPEEAFAAEAERRRRLYALPRKKHGPVSRLSSCWPQGNS